MIVLEPELAGRRWRVQRGGRGPVLLLLHGTGAAAASWRDVAPRLAERFTVVAPDLPGHGGAALPPPSRMRLPAMAEDLAALLQALDLAPQGIVGHSAGAAIAAQMALAPGSTVRRLAWINPALLPFDGWPGLLFAPLARWLTGGRLLPSLVAWHARDRRAVQRLVAGTGSRLDEEGVAVYQRLVADPRHVAGALAMMAHWDLAPLQQRLPQLRAPALMLVGDNDRTVPPAQARQLQARLPGAQLQLLPGLGHLAHEERPAPVAQALADWFAPLGG